MSSSANMQTIIRIANMPGMNAKLEVLKQHPELKGLLMVCYSPFINFYVKPTEGWIQDTGVNEFDADTNKLINALINRRLTGNAAKQAVVHELGRLEPLSQVLLLRILNKDLRFGLGAKSINKVFPGLIPHFEVQLAKLYTPGKMAWPCLGSFKIDGLRCIYENGKLYSRYGKEFVGLDHIAEHFKKYNVRRVDGEIIVPGKRFDDLSGDIRAFKKTDDAQYMVFDVHSDEALPLYKRQTNALLLCNAIASRDVQYVEHRTLCSEQEALDMYDEALSEGYEGLMLKKDNGLPVDGRNNDWLKMKPKDTVDLVVTGVEEGDGKYIGAVGNLVCDFNGREVRVGGGLSDLQRTTWYSDSNAIVGRTIEVEYMELSKEGRLRHPRLKCVRGDK